MQECELEPQISLSRLFTVAKAGASLDVRQAKGGSNGNFVSTGSYAVLEIYFYPVFFIFSSEHSMSSSHGESGMSQVYPMVPSDCGRARGIIRAFPEIPARIDVRITFPPGRASGFRPVPFREAE